MEQSPADGLNFVPFLERNLLSAPCSSRSRVSLNKKVSHKSLVCYNGNYEGDTSMFREKGLLQFKHLNFLEDTDSDETEFKKNFEVYKKPQRIVKSARLALSENQLWCFLHFYMLRILRPEMVERITKCVECVYDSTRHGRLSRVVKCLKTLLHWISLLLMVIGTRMASVSSVGLWKCRIFFRNATRRLLWWMTLAKCGDLLLFALVLFGIPWLFLLASAGFVISLYCALREWGQRSVRFLRSQLF